MKGVMTADWHIRATPPSCVSDTQETWMMKQFCALQQIFVVCKEKKCDLFLDGDVFNSISDTTCRCITLVQDLALQLLDENLKLYILAGNHDLPYHTSTNIHKSAIGVLFSSKNIYNMSSLNDDKIYASSFDGENKDAEIVFRHVLCVPTAKDLFPGSNAFTANTLLESYKLAKWIFTGDYHHAFHYENNGKHVVNPGCLLRQASDMIDYKPLVYYVDTENNVVEEHFLNIPQFFVEAKSKDNSQETIDAFVECLSHENMSVDFVQNIKNSLSKVSEPVAKKISDWIEKSHI